MVDIKEILWNYADEVKKRMISKGVSNRQLAYAARITSGSMARYKSGVCFPEPWTLVLIADYLDCSVDELLRYPNSRTQKMIRRKVPAVKKFPNWDLFAVYFRDRLIKFMEDKSMAPKDLAEASGSSIKTIEMYLSVHKWTPQTPDLLRICDALDCTPSDLLGY